jgi:hypothetical protein
VLGADGQPKIKDAQGNPFTLNDLVEQMKQDPTFQPAFGVSGASGSGIISNRI